MRWAALAIACVMSLSTWAGPRSDIPEEWFGTLVHVRLTTGDVLRGELLSRAMRDSIEAIKVRTAVGTATIDLDQVVEIRPLESFYRHAWRTLLMPTAEPIGTNHSILSMELLTLGAGIGVGQIGSILLLRSIVPGIPASHQLSVINAKATLVRADYQQLDGHLSLCVGGNLAWINAPNRLQHVWIAGTFTRVRSRLTVMAFYNLSDRDVYQLNAGTFGSALMRYTPNAIGFGLGLDVQLPARDDLHVLAELWNSDLARPYQTMVVVGVRLANTALALDAGVGVSSLPLVIPIVAASWTPW
ncbi:MAG: hypothetical protein KatS3mg039_1332 [Candidatus Kapaibacterium sp.]|nr:MAG: hypothetical protein KatS3mg039_1332 [Candidatus Kapabacteria bacterium]